MAQMYPEWLPDRRGTKGEKAEQKVYWLLNAALGPEVTVIAGRELLDPGKAERQVLEMDFLVLAPGRPPLVVEIKSDIDRQLTNPRVAGIDTQLHDLHRGVGRALGDLPGAPRELQGGVAVALALPNAAAPSVTTVAAGIASVPDLVFAGEDHVTPEHMRAAIERALTWWEREADEHGHSIPAVLSPATIELIVHAHAPSWFGSPLRLLTSGAIGQQLVLTEQQFLALRFAERHPRVALTGGAGTGKTVVARRRALDVAAAGKRVLLLCHGRPLADWLEREAGALHRDIDVRTFDEIEDGIARRDTDAKVDDAWLAEELRDRPDAVTGAYDAVIVDEAQDVSPGRLEQLDRYLRDPGAGQLLLLWDDHQVLYREHARLPDGYLCNPLEQNLRNTRDIHHLASVFRQMGTWEPPDPDGPAVALDLIAHDGELLDEIDRIVAEAHRDARVPRGDIAVLIASGVEQARMRFRERDRLGGVPIVRDASDWSPSGGRVLLDSVRRFRGLEARVVVLVGIDALLRDPQPWLDDILYVAFTRARAWVSVVGTGAELDGLVRLLRRRGAKVVPFRCSACGELALCDEAAPPCHRCGARTCELYALPLHATAAPGLPPEEVGPLRGILSAGPGRADTLLVTREPIREGLDRVLGVAGGTPVLVWSATLAPDLDRPLHEGIEIDPLTADALVDVLNRPKLRPRRIDGDPSRVRLKVRQSNGPAPALACGIAELIGGAIADARRVGAAECLVVFPVDESSERALTAGIGALCKLAPNRQPHARSLDGGLLFGPFPIADRRRPTATTLLWVAGVREPGGGSPARTPKTTDPPPTDRVERPAARRRS